MTEPRIPSRPRVLAVEDDRQTLQLLGLLLSSWGYEPILAEDGETALAALTPVGPLPEAVLLDLGLPGIDGCQVARELRRRPGGDAPLIVVVTGAHGEEARAREAGCDHYLTKPVNIPALRQVLERVRTG
ncbi:MAG TPA: response regulator [Thermoanaerobaculia bacterium]|nr:response regulator [Thermoanaerobaculia bacterium]